MTTTSETVERLRQCAKNVRRNVLKMARGKGEGYVGQGLGCADILSVIYFHELRSAPGRLDDPGRDRFLLSTGHYSIALYATLTEWGLYSELDLASYGADGHPFGMSACDASPCVEITGGSLGQGLPQAVGMALGARLSGRGFRVFNFLSDGELDEGSTWEAAMAAAHYELDNLVALVDMNGVQADGKVDEVMRKEPALDKWLGFGWHARRVNGNSIPELLDALAEALRVGGRPKVLLCDTVMGYGVPFIASREKAHFLRVNPDEWDRALETLEVQA